MTLTCFQLAERFVGTAELAGTAHHPLIQWWLSLCGYALDTPDEVPWCAAFCQAPPWLLRLPRSKSAAARSWLTVGRPIALEHAHAANDVVILSRGLFPQPGPEVLDAPGHVGFFAGLEGDRVLLLGGNQANAVTVHPFSRQHVLGVRRLVD